MTHLTVTEFNRLPATKACRIDGRAHLLVAGRWVPVVLSCGRKK